MYGMYCKCGGEVVVHVSIDGYRCECLKCGAYSGHSKSFGRAKLLWKRQYQNK